MVSNDENITSPGDVLKAKRVLNQTHLQQPKKGTVGAMPSENLAPREQPGAAQLIKKYQNRLRKKERLKSRTVPSVGVNIPQRLGETLPFPSKVAEKSKDAEEVAPEAEDTTQQQLESVRQSAREQKASATKGQQEKALNRQGNRLQWTIRKHKARMPLLVAVLTVALLKDTLDIMGELISVGTWSWLDWILDTSLGISAYLLGIEKNSKDRMIGWGFVVIEIIPYAGILPAWTIRVTRAMHKSWKKISESNKSLENIEKRKQSLQTKKSA
ncbi:MAG: hypothetical protein COT24_04610 [Candidatus Kerfeldbacteria bacterium CG08_land_8_20_14_0_20_40_16]|uniref:Uncharacterized protein n=1 Tax=Candidatus Kerfeldbacteria bacterium CG08_land_8_20_14_0_20_40_16 TaxID=2014244 RepID=A0A2H0YUU0_9BACT|nr:MAG: hypothetical protein COT24_04610 [Candidatus Kerfeldbacteria bacterium CG08_land_8_20_14_0_20_40_16]